ncbi:sodium:proton antiporter [Desulfoferrobacter suflitae]|uniref:sodium:proton antiporter n=1 Tax=Desulfoferrobacter suflitae TaxID=2865782 RepID=UPI00216440D0|nr:sodium:proton antiporter [Desulfoferrobacter suflitae]MCK8600343.1 sodium:proton antiporter [Desulfoferrobacter suflitae]
MNQPTWYALTGVILFSMGIHAFVIRTHLVRRILAFNIMGSGVFLLLVAIAHRIPGAAPDPVPHALVLTGIVVSVSFTAFGLVLLKKIYAKTGKTALIDPTESTSDQTN